MVFLAAVGVITNSIRLLPDFFVGDNINKGEGQKMYFYLLFHVVVFN